MSSRLRSSSPGRTPTGTTDLTWFFRHHLRQLRYAIGLDNKDRQLDNKDRRKTTCFFAPLLFINSNKYGRTTAA
ncbi:hypothetical protein F0562_021419 [Nyssa sinensis]|uniref:Uncharacterized protein n=1 Tax=Nyssa sinensis TaxID=561372 RepID=A0A5J5BKD5_9ASTE|nr:hypothetical protein F0562_021419 [Nyssa sinensis]